MRALVADDEATNRIVLKRLMSRWGYDVVVADNGKKAWDILSEEDGPRLAVLDWLMPGFDGVDICRMLGERIDGPYIYTVLITHKTESEAMITALDSGADDFIRKPVDPMELKSRLGVARRVLAYDQRVEDTTRLLRQYGREMESLAEERAKQLVHADRMATLGMLSAGVAHEVNNPTTFISGNVQTIERFWEDASQALNPDDPLLDPALARKVRFIMNEMPSAIGGIQNGVARISKIVRGLKDYSRHDKGERKLCDPAGCIERALEIVRFQVEKQNVEVQVLVQEDLPAVNVDSQQIEQVIINLVVNASHAIEKCANPVVQVSASARGGNVLIGVNDNGPGIPEDIVAQIWNPFFTTKSAGKGTGLGLSICKRIAEEHDGGLTVANGPEGGACFSLTVPACEQEAVA